MSLTALLIHSIESLGLKDTLFGKGRRNGETKKLLLAMKLTAFILISACMIASAKGNTQGVTLSVKNAPLETVFKELKKQTGYQFLYNNQMLDGSKKVSINISNGTIEQVLEICFKDQALTYTIVDKTIIVKEKEKTPNEEANLRNEPPPPIDVTGKVTDADGNPLSGATVKVKGSSKGTTTNNDGVFVLKGVDEDATLEISFVGYETYTVAVANKSAIVASLKVKPESLNEVVINKGYYTEKQRLSASNVGKVTSKDIEKQPVQNLLLALEGRIPGLFITQTSGVPGGGVQVQIQGQNSIKNGNDPFIVVDGVPFYSSLPLAGNDEVLGSSRGVGSNANGNPLSFLNPLDIESIEVLKDADATAIYGSRAANGAILITTKKGKAGKTKFDFNVQQGWGKVTRFMKMLNRRQYLDMRYQAFKNDGIDIKTLTPNSSNYDLTVWDTTRYTDWQKVLIGGTAKYTNINASTSGGTANMQYLLGGTYHRETTVFPGNFADQKASVHFSLNSLSTNQRFRLLLSSNYMMNDNRLPGIDLTGNANLLEPVAPALYKSDGNLNWAPDPSGRSTWTNPLAAVLYQKYKNQTNNLISNLQLSYLVLKSLELKSSFGYTNLQTTDFFSYPLVSFKPEDQPNILRSAIYGNRLMRSWIIEPQLLYKKQIGVSHFNAFVGTSIQQSRGNGGSIRGYGHSSDQVLEDFKRAATLEAGNSSIIQQKFNALFGHVNYDYREKYVANVNIRRDGSSRFGRNNRFHNFWSLSGAWLFSEEKFMQQGLRFLSFGKLRASYGTTGNDQIGDYQFLNLYNSVTVGVPYQGYVGLSPGSLPNPYLEWEETRKIQLGVDLIFFNNRLSLSGTYSRNRCSNQLIGYPLPVITGYYSVTTNLPATVQNTSWELLIATNNIKANDFSWSSTINVTVPRNELISYPGLSNSTFSSNLIVGQPLNIIKVYRYLGVDPVTGVYKVTDKDGNSTSNPNYNTDRTVLVSTLPKFYGGFENSVVYKGFQLDFLFQFVRQLGINNYFNNGTIVAPGSFISGYSNQPASVIQTWQKTGDNALIQKYSSDVFSNTSSYLDIVKGSNGVLSDASFIRLKNLSLSWHLPERILQKAHLQNLRLFLQGQNLLTITKYKGMDPENQGFQSLPPLKILTVGLQVGL